MAVQRVFNQSINAATESTVDVGVTDWDQITIVWQLQGTTTPTDLAGDVVPFLTATTVGSQSMPYVRTQAPAAGGGNVWQTQQYDVRGLDTVRIRIDNNNVGAKTGVIDVFFGGHTA